MIVKCFVMNKLKLFTAILSIVPQLVCFSQKNKSNADTTAAIREFISVCNQYKKLPLHLVLRQSNSATFGVSDEDTASSQADFYMTEQGVYMRYGNIEQLIDDSLILMISPDKKVMMIYPHSQSIKEQLSGYIGLQMADSSVLKMAATYASEFLSAGSEQQKIIQIRNRSPLPGTDITKEVITMKYDSKSGEPEEVTYLRRTLVPIDKAEWDKQSNHGDLNDKLVAIKDNYFLINEHKSVFEYKKISHDTEIKLPASISDRITRNEEGKFVPAKGFENYYLGTE